MIDTIFVPRGAEERAVRRALGRTLAVHDALAGPTMGRALVVGLCGLLSPAFAVGETLVYGEIVSATEATVTIDRAFAGDVARALGHVQSGIRALGVADVVTSGFEKLDLGRRYDAQAVDMESLPLVRHLQRAGVAVAVARVGSDAAGDDLPDLHMALDGSGGLDGFALALAMLRRPIAGARLARNGTHALAALEAMIGALVAA
jgi:hypothetical protein